MTIKIDSNFATPTALIETNEEQLCDELYDFIIAKMTEKNRINDAPQYAHPDLFESKFDFLHWDYPVIRKLREVFFKYLLEFLSEVCNLTKTDLSRIKFQHESWFHVAKMGGYFQSHTHPNHSWTMVFCVSPGDKIASNEFEAGKLLIIDPRHNASMYLDPANKDLKRDYSFNGIKIKYKKANMLIFPSYLQHSVEPYLGNKYRITVPVNFRFHYE